MKTSKHFWLFLFLTVWLTHGCGGEAQRTFQERTIRVDPPPGLTLEIPEPEPPPVPPRGEGQGMVVEDMIHWYETYLSLLKEAFLQAEADKAAIREWCLLAPCGDTE